MKNIKIEGPHTRAWVVLLHGYGSWGGDLLAIAQELHRHRPDLGVWCPNGLESCESFPMGYQWFSLEGFDLKIPHSIARIQERCRKAADLFLDRLEKEFSDSKKLPLFLGGFSQGAAFAYFLGLQRLKVQGVLGFSGFYALQEEPTYKPPLLWCHGDADQVVSVEWMKSAEIQFAHMGVSFQGHILKDVAHTIVQETLSYALAFLTLHFPKDPVG